MIRHVQLVPSSNKYSKLINDIITNDCDVLIFSYIFTRLKKRISHKSLSSICDIMQRIVDAYKPTPNKNARLITRLRNSR